MPDTTFGGFDTRALHAGHTPDAEQEAAGVTPDFVRLSVGLETIDDILADLDQALAKT